MDLAGTFDGIAKVEADGALDPHQIRALFTSCGQIIDIYPCLTDLPGRQHLFIQFKDKATLERALKINIPGLCIYSISENPHLGKQCQATMPADFSSNEGKTRSWRINNSRPNSHRCYISPPDAPERNQYAEAITPGLFFESLKSYRRRPSRFSNDGLSLSYATDTKTKFKNSSNLAIASSTCLPSAPNTLSVSYLEKASTMTTPKSLDTLLKLSFCGESIIFDLKSLDQDPRPVTELLKVTTSERGSWMIVGAHYRRLGNPSAAIAVIEAMLSVMSQQGLSETDLKPAFLLLAGSEADLAKRAESTHSNVAEKHFKASQKWLQKVYGTFIANSNSSSSRPGGDHKNACLPIPRGPRAHVAPECRDLGLVQTTPLYTGASAREIVLENEIKLLVGARKEESGLMADTRAAKRKLEGDLAFERDRRRRLLRDFDELEQELSTVRKMENFALSQVKREVEARRKAEDQARRERSLRLELQKILEGGTALPLSEIANTLKMDEPSTPGSSVALKSF